MRVQRPRSLRVFLVLASLLLASLSVVRSAAAASAFDDTIVEKAGPDPEGQIRAAFRRYKRIRFDGPAPRISAEFLAQELMRNGAVADTSRLNGDGSDTEAAPAADAKRDEPPPLRISNVKIAGNVLLSRRTIPRFVELDRTVIEGDFQCTDCVFQQRFELFKESKIQGDVRLYGSKFRDMLELQETVITGELNLAWVRVDSALILDRMTVHGALVLRGARAASAQAFRLNVGGCPNDPKTGQPKCFVDGSGMAVEGHFQLAQAVIASPFALQNARIGGDLDLTGTRFPERTSLFATKVERCLMLENTRFEGELDLSDLTFARLTVDGGRSDESVWDTMQPLLRKSPFSAELYARVEAYFRDRGEPDLADGVYIERSSQERKRKLSGASVFVNLLEEAFVGYGRRPYLAFVWSLVFVWLGAYIFKQERMALQDPQAPAPTYSAFWYSLDVFIPLTHLRAAEVWAPKKTERWTWVYLRVHHLVGWILIPLGLAAVSGLVN